MSQYIYAGILAVGILIAGYIAILGAEVKSLKLDNQNLKTEKVIILEESKVKEFENNQTIEVYKQKGVHDEVNTSIGFHSLSF